MIFTEKKITSGICDKPASRYRLQNRHCILELMMIPFGESLRSTVSVQDEIRKSKFKRYRRYQRLSFEKLMSEWVEDKKIVSQRQYYGLE